MNKTISILGTRGIPAKHGGFETFAEHLSKYLVNKGWNVYVYCQLNGNGNIYYDKWNDIQLINIPVKKEGAIGTIIFDWKSTLHAAKRDSLILTLGYNTAIFSIWYRFRNKINIINMDGIEWKRKKWSLLEKSWLYLNERFGCYAGNHLIADHPEIENHLSRIIHSNKITMIPYGSDKLSDSDVELIKPLGLEPNNYAIVIARPEPENSVLEIVSAFSKKQRNIKLVVLGDYDNGNTLFCNKVKEAASDEVIFPGAIYNKSMVQALRVFALLYIHGHQVGGTNPSLVESLGAKNPILAHDNKFNRWVAGNINRYFTDSVDCDHVLSELLNDYKQLSLMRLSSEKRHDELFTHDCVLEEYEHMLSQYI
ncbi:MAG: DUF1972 domain-containing protein [Candidatus Thiodiazotropha sp.]